MIQLVLSDVDRTLVPFGSPAVSGRTLAAIALLRGAGIGFGVASGREPSDLGPLFLGHDECFQTEIMSN